MAVATIEIWNPANTAKLADGHVTVGDDEFNVVELEVDLIENEPGTCEFSTVHDHPAAPHLYPYNVVRSFNENGTQVHAGVVQRVAQVLVDAEAGEGELLTTTEADGLLSRLSEGVVVHWPGANRQPYGPVRVFDALSPAQDFSDWDTIHNQSRNYGIVQRLPRPTGWSEPYSLWVHPNPDASTQPVGKWPIIRPFYLEYDMTLMILHAADDEFRAYIDGVPMQQSETDEGAWRNVPLQDRSWWNTHVIPIELKAGWHLFGYTVRNWRGESGNPSGMIAAAWEYDEGEFQRIIFITGEESGSIEQYFLETVFELPPGSLSAVYGEWLSPGYSMPGFTPGKIMRILVEEAQARGALLEWVLDFDDDLDSSGDAWPEISAFFIDVGSTVLDALEQLIDDWVDVGVVNGDGYVLQMWNKGHLEGAPVVSMDDGTHITRRERILEV